MKAKLYVIPVLFACLIGGNLKAQFISTFAGNGFGADTGTGSYTGDGGLAVYATLNSPSAVTFDGAGNIYIADANNHVVRKVNTVGVITTIAGSGTSGYTGDGGPATLARLNNPQGVAVDVNGNVFVADQNHVIRKINTAGVISTFAGMGIAGYSGDNGPADSALLNDPHGMAIDAAGNLYVADAGNHAVRKIDTFGTIMTVAGIGTSGYSGNGGLATDARLNFPVDVAVDVQNNFYVADYLNNVIRMVDPGGNISTVAGNTVIGFGGDGGPATSANFHYPSSVSVDAARNIYIADQGNSRIRRVDTAGVITNYAGTFANGYAGDGGLATSAKLSSPKDVTVDGWGRVYIADYDNNVIRIIASTIIVGVSDVEQNNLSVYPNPAKGDIRIEFAAKADDCTISIVDVAGRIVDVKTVQNSSNAAVSMSVNTLATGTYIVKVTDGGNTYRQVINVVK